MMDNDTKMFLDFLANDLGLEHELTVKIFKAAEDGVPLGLLMDMTATYFDYEDEAP